jgi:hypothetical protein
LLLAYGVGHVSLVELGSSVQQPAANNGQDRQETGAGQGRAGAAELNSAARHRYLILAVGAQAP